MFPLSLPLSLALIVAPGDESISVPQLDHLRPTIQAVGVALELLDTRELPHYFAKRDEFTADLCHVRRRWVALKDCPPAHDAKMFPTPKAILGYLEMNRAFKDHLERLGGMTAYDQWDRYEAIQECERSYRVWDAMRDAGQTFYHVNVRREALEKVRQLIGYQAYYSGQWPPIVPVRFFAKVN